MDRVLVGQLVGGKYLLSRQIGKGGMGRVFEAVHATTGGHVAVKVVVTAETKGDDELTTRLEREARATATVASQHIVRVFDAGVDEAIGLPYIAMELLEGEDAQQLLRRVGPLPPDLALRIAAQACVGLAGAHETGIIHRDIKPANLFLARADEDQIVVKIFDFGIAKLTVDQLHSSESGGLTRTGSMLGTPQYISPEQALGLKTVDAKTDIWSLGAVLYKFLTGNAPYESGGTLAQVLLDITRRPVPAVQSLAPWVPPEVAAIVHRALKRKREERFATAREMLDALRACLPEGYSLKQSMLVGVGRNQRLDAESRAEQLRAEQSTRLVMASEPDDAPRVAASRRSRSRRRSLPLLLATAAIAAAGAYATYTLRNRGVVAAAPPPPSSGEPDPASGETRAAASAPAPIATVALAISPPDASVDVDGEKASVSEGRIQLSGAQGSLHRVHVRSGQNETSMDVAITEHGALPPAVGIDKSAGGIDKSATPAHARPATPARSQPGRPPQQAAVEPPGAPTAVNITKQFE